MVELGRIVLKFCVQCLTDLLTQYHSAVQKRDAVQKDFESHRQKSQSADWLNKQQEMEAIKQQLDQINRQSTFDDLAAEGVSSFFALHIFNIKDF